MTRRKSVCLKWTLVLVLIVLCPYVYSRPQELSHTVVSSSSTLGIDKPTEDPIRYRYRHYNVSFHPHQAPLDVSVVHNMFNIKNITNHKIDKAHVNYFTPNKIISTHNNNSNILNRRLSRIIRHRLKNNVQNQPKRKINSHNKNTTKVPLMTKEKNKPVIKKVVTKWTDNAKYEDLNFSYESTTTDENDFVKFGNILTPSQYSAENNVAEPIDPTDKRVPDKRYRPRPQYSEETQIYTNNIQIVDSYPFSSTRPPYIFSTPNPTPVITNVGYPPPWPQYQQTPIHQYNTPQTRPTTQKPKLTKPTNGPYDYHNTFQNNYPQYPNFEVTTFPPTTAYTDRIIIRPEEYSGSPDDCPTIFLTLNNTFQGQGKEACPDLNIAVNTNVINKNVVIESEEENDTSLTDAFNIPLVDDSESEETSQNYFDSAENQEEESEISESASVEATGLTNYNAANTAQSSESGVFGGPSAALSEINRPDKPSDNDDDSFGLSSILSFFQPALSAFAWLATINPLSFGLLSLLLAPLALLVAGTSGVAALFAPWAFSYGREAPKVVQVHRPHWQWDYENKAWELNSFPDRHWQSSSRRIDNDNVTNIKSFIRLPWFDVFKDLMTNAIRTLTTAQRKYDVHYNRKNVRKKRETWTIRVK